MNREVESFFNKLNNFTNNLENKRQEEERKIREEEKKVKELNNTTKKDLNQLGVYEIFTRIRDNNILTLDENYIDYKGRKHRYIPCEIEFLPCDLERNKHGYTLSINRYTTWDDGQAYWRSNSIRVLKDKAEHYYVGYDGEYEYRKEKKVERNEILDTLFKVVTLCETYKGRELNNHLDSFLK